jgi:CRISPR-associated protein Csd1
LGWFSDLYELYENNLDRVGTPEYNTFGKTITLLPIAHTTQYAHIEITIDADGNYLSGRVLEKAEQNTMIPATEYASSRSGTKIAPYPLHDQLKYVAGDYSKYDPNYDNTDHFAAYIAQLGDWVHSPYGNPTVETIFNYVSKETVIADLVADGILFLDARGQVIQEWKSEYEADIGPKPPVFTAIQNGTTNLFVRFLVYSTEKVLAPPWDDAYVYQSFVQFYQTTQTSKELCYVTGKEMAVTQSHANKIRHAGDKSKLISSNDTSGLTFRGRFLTSDEAVGVGYTTSQKAHNALKWLIARQADTIDERVFLVWNSVTIDDFKFTDNSYALEDEEDEETVGLMDTGEHFADRFSKALRGYHSKLIEDLKLENETGYAKVNIMVLDAATTGRLAVLYYRTLDQDQYFNRLLKWHVDCAWRQSHWDFQKEKRVYFFGAPSLSSVAYAAYGRKADKKLIKSTIERLVPCVIDGKAVPTDIVQQLFNRACNPLALEGAEWIEIMGILCGMIHKKEGFDLALDTQSCDRDYLFGRLLAVADVLEADAIRGAEKRTTNAMRYMQAFQRHPFRTWTTIQSSIMPYQMKLGGFSIRYTKLIDEIGSMFNVEDFNDRPLSGRFLLGLYSQRNALYQKKGTHSETMDDADAFEDAES